MSQDLSGSEVTQGNFLAFVKDVVWLDVSVCYLQLMDEVEPSENLVAEDLNV